MILSHASVLRMSGRRQILRVVTSKSLFGVGVVLSAQETVADQARKLDAKLIGQFVAKSHADLTDCLEYGDETRSDISCGIVEDGRMSIGRINKSEMEK